MCMNITQTYADGAAETACSQSPCLNLSDWKRESVMEKSGQTSGRNFAILWLLPSFMTLCDTTGFMHTICNGGLQEGGLERFGSGLGMLDSEDLSLK